MLWAVFMGIVRLEAEGRILGDDQAVLEPASPVTST